MKNKIIWAAAEEMVTRGLKFTMGDLAAKLRVSKTTLYEHFASKEEIINAVLAVALDDMRQQDEAIYADPMLTLPEKLQALFTVVPDIFGPINNQRIYEDLRCYHPGGQEMLEAFKQEQFRCQSALLAECIASKTARPVNLPVLQQVLVSATNELFTYRFLTENKLTIADALADLADIIIFGLLSRDGGRADGQSGQKAGAGHVSSNEA